MNKIHFWDNPNEHNERKDFRNKLNSLNIKTTINFDDLTGMNIAFVHGFDSSSLQNEFAFNLEVFKITFGDNPTTNYGIFYDENRISYINARELFDSFESIYSQILAEESLTIEKLQGIIFNKNSNLSNLLKPFASCDPFNLTQDQKAAIQPLNDFVAGLIEKNKK